MAMGNRLFALAEREFKANRTTRVRERFRGMNLNVGKYDEGWDRKRGSAVRMMAVILRDDDEGLYARVTESAQAAKTYASAAAWLLREGEYLRKTAGMLDTAAARLKVVLDRYEGSKDPITN